MTTLDVPVWVVGEPDGFCADPEPEPEPESAPDPDAFPPPLGDCCPFAGASAGGD